jgi:ADP-dependent NAD(P)H-hydrate dehydratase / NAD(P)H-hydrate epimerase
MKLVTIAEMRAVEREADAQGWTYAEMMQKAGFGLAELVHSFYGYEERLVVTALVGSGNNGGDALVALSALAEVGWQVCAYLVKARSETDELILQLRQAGGAISGVENDPDFKQLDEWIAESTVLLDGVLGTGIQLPLKEDVAGVLRHVKESAFCPPVVAVDCPSGIDCDTGKAADECLPAEMTVCMAAVKAGLLSFPAFQLAGDLQVVDIGLSDGLAAWDAIRREVISEDVVSAILPERPADGHKGTFGTAAICAGSINFSGAVLLAAQAAGKMGTGLVQVSAPSPLHSALAGFIPNVTWVLLPHQMGAISGDAAGVLLKSLGRATALLIGPGFGLEDCTADFVRRLLDGRLNTRERGHIGFVSAKPDAQAEPLAEKELPPMVIDADGLKLLARIEDWPTKLHSMAVLTPHPGEMAILTGLTTEEIQNQRLEIASQYAQKWGHVVVLKGAFTVVASPDGRASVVPVATTALSHGGTGDVLSGMITGLRAQGVAPFEAAVAGAWLHAHAGLAAANKVGHEASVQATDVVDAIPEMLAWVWQ